jgi:hypothetical protein
VPAAAYNVAAQLLAREDDVDGHPPRARVHVRDGLWMTLSAARIESGSTSHSAAIAVTIEPTPPLERAGLYARVGSQRDARPRSFVTSSVVAIRELAGKLFVSEHTVQDHLNRSSPRPERTAAGC